METELEQLKKLYPDEESLADVASFEKNLKKSGLLLNLLQHDGFKGIVRNYENELERINKTLYTTNLFNSEEDISKGKLLYARKQWINDFLAIFRTAKIEDGYTRSKIKSLLEPEQ